MAIIDSRGEPGPYDVPIKVSLANQLIDLARRSIQDVLSSELIPYSWAVIPSAQQRLFTPRPGVGLANSIEQAIVAGQWPKFRKSTDLARKNLLVFRIADGLTHLANVYQTLSQDNELVRSRRIPIVWQGDAFQEITERTLILDREMRLISAAEYFVFPRANAYETAFGALEELIAQARATYDETLGGLEIDGGEALRQACGTDINMMRKLASIKRKLMDPDYAKSLTMENLLDFIDQNPEIDVRVEGSGSSRQLVFERHPQRRWALLKLIDDDYLKSELTNRKYETNSKIERGH